MKKFITILTLAAAVLTSCGEKPAPDNGNGGSKVQFIKHEVSIYKGCLYRAILEDQTAKVKYSTANERIAVVSELGNVTGVQVGKTYIYAESGESKDSVEITVKGATDDERAFHGADWHWTPLPDGGEYGTASIKMWNSTQNISIIRFSEADYTTELIYNSGTSCVIVPTAAANAGADMAINASFFKTDGTFLANTTTIMNHKLLTTASDSEATNRSTGIVHFKGGKIFFDSYDKSQIETYRELYDASISSGPLLILGGKTQTFASRDFNTARHPRTMIGNDKWGDVYFVVVDGRFTGKAAGATIPEMALLGEYLNLRGALNLDGGGSSTIWAKNPGVLNYPCDNSNWDHAGCRRCPTVIIAKKK